MDVLIIELQEQLIVLDLGSMSLPLRPIHVEAHPIAELTEQQDTLYKNLVKPFDFPVLPA